MPNLLRVVTRVEGVELNVAKVGHVCPDQLMSTEHTINEKQMQFAVRSRIADERLLHNAGIRSKPQAVGQIAGSRGRIPKLRRAATRSTAVGHSIAQS